jgi:hypothetical protein
MIQQQVYEIFIKFEEHSANLYLDLSTKFHENPALSWFWVEMAMEEKQHAGLLQFCRETGTRCEVTPTDEQIQQLGGLFKDLGTRMSVANLTLDDAFDIAIAMESSEINEIYDHLVANVSGPFYVIRRKIELSVRNHIAKLRAAAVQFGASRSTVERLEELEQKETVSR